MELTRTFGAVIFSLALTAASASAATNLLTNPGFESGLTGWSQHGGGRIALTTIHHTGSFGAYVYDRTQWYQGIRQSVLGVMQHGQTYRISAWVKLENAQSDNFSITFQQTDDDGTRWIHAVDDTGYSDRWTQLIGYFTPNVAGTLTELLVYVEEPAVGVNFYVDDMVVESTGDWETDANQRIEQIRKTDIRITALSPTDIPLDNANVEIRQIRRHFAFGSAISQWRMDNDAYLDFFKDHFQWAVMENASKWYGNEPTQGNVTYARADTIWDFCSANNITMRGHAIYWGVDQFVQDWIKALDNTALQQAVESRMDSVVNHFKGKFVHWDVNNEMLHGSFYADRLGESIRTWMFQAANAIDPECRLFVNDYSVVSGGQTNAYKAHIQALIDSGAPVGGIGVQCHMGGGSISAIAVYDRLNMLADLGLPIWVTEYDFAAADEIARADALETFYRIAFSHPSVEGILMWGFWENSHWRENCHIVNADWTLNEAGRRYEALLTEWTTHDSAATDAAGNADFRPFYGTHEILLTHPRLPATVKTIQVNPGEGTYDFTLKCNGQGLRYEYYEGNWTVLPDFDSLTAVDSGYTTNFGTDRAQRKEYFGLRFTGFIDISAADNYAFYTTSDDGSRLYINGALVVNNNGLHSATESGGAISLPAGKHSIKVEFFQAQGPAELTVRYSRPGMAKRQIPDALLFTGVAPRIGGDIDADDRTDFKDFAIMGDAWQQPAASTEQADLNYDNVLNASDLIMFTDNWLGYYKTPPRAHWPMDETTGDTAPDNSVNLLDGTLSNMDDADWVTGNVGNALAFDGIDDFVEIGGFTGMLGGRSRTVCAWIMTDTPGTVIIAWGLGGTPAGRWLFATNGAGRLRVEVGGGFIEGTADVCDGAWHYVAAVLANDGSPNINEVKLYVDGLPDKLSWNESDRVIATLAGSYVSIGAFSDAGFFEGTIDDVRIYDRALSNEEIAAFAP